ncbi:hypothetical protein TNCV_4266791 [Trichonephila clavipes]|nr:hypothetical protein TNCV_4266791 [Trichonephila clavipes]
MQDWFDARRKELVRSVLLVTSIPIDGHHSSKDRNEINLRTLPSVIRWSMDDDLYNLFHMIWVDTDPPAPGGNRLRMSRAMDKGSQIVNWRICQYARSDVHLCASLPLRCTCS